MQVVCRVLPDECYLWTVDDLQRIAAMRVEVARKHGTIAAEYFAYRAATERCYLRPCDLTKLPEKCAMWTLEDLQYIARSRIPTTRASSTNNPPPSWRRPLLLTAIVTGSISL